MKKQYVVSAASVLLFRTLLSGIFIIAGISHLLQPDKSTARIGNSSFKPLIQYFGDFHTLGILSGIILLTGGVLLLLGLYSRWAALALLVVLIPITVTIQTGNGMMYGPLWKNIALAGGLLFFILNHQERFTATPPTL
jgi:putative oxidoreductase